MKNFMEMIENETKKTMTSTENGALAYETSGKKLLDFMFAVTALRGCSEKEIMDKFTGVYFENPMIANKFAFYLRDIRGGVGERKIFRAYLRWLAENKPEVAKAIISLVPEYARWDDLWVLLDTPLKDDVIKLVKTQLESDIDNCEKGIGVSLLIKWLKSENTSSKESRRQAKIIREGLGLTPRQYRKTLSTLRAYLDVVEVKTSGNKWGEIRYEVVPSQAGIKYSAAFMRHDHDRYTEYLNSVKKGETKINANVLAPHEIVAKYVDGTWCREVKAYDEALEQLWKALPDKTIGNTLVVADSSGSMLSGYGSTVRPIDVAAGLAVYMSERNGDIWKNKILSFSHNPKIISFENCDSLHDKLGLFYSNSEYSNTDIEKTMMLILDTAINNHCSQDDMPKNILILSDTQFDGIVTIHGDMKTLFENIADEYKRHGYMMPRIIFWNLSGSVNNTIPMQENEAGLVLMSGFSVHLLDMIMSGKTDPYEVILETLNSQRYLPVELAVRDVVS